MRQFGSVTASRKHRVTRIVEKWVLNPVPRLALRLGIAPKAYALLETTGRKTGRTRRTPVAGYVEGGPSVSTSREAAPAADSLT